ncbi:MAG: hypothetical protein RL594_903 [Bacteroidota bacterium]|jgi:hypothetical protein
MRTWLPSVVVLLLGVFQAHAQVEIFINEANKADSVIEFGVTRPDEAVVSSFRVRNQTSKEVKIVATRLDMSGGVSDVVIEYDTVFSNEESVKPNTTLTFNVVYRARGTFPTDSVAEIRLVLDAVDVLTDSTLQQKILILRGLKTNKAIGSLQRFIAFDSVYVNPNPVPFTRYRVQNLLRTRLALRSQNVRLKTSLVGGTEMFIDTTAFVEFAERGAVEWPVRYLPIDRGPDSAEFILAYANRDDEADTTLVTRISGFGVEQRIDLGPVAVQTGLGLLEVVDGAIQIRDVLAGADPVILSIPLINSGNIDIHLDSVRIQSLSQQSPFRILRPVSKIGVGQTEILVLQFAPDRKGQFSARLELYTDLSRRSIRGVPGSAVNRIVPLFGESQSLFDVRPDVVDLGTLFISPRCSLTETREFEVVNLSSTDIVIDSIRFNPPDLKLSVMPASLTVPSNGTRTLQLSFSPTMYGRVSGDIQLHTSAAERVRPIPFTVNSRPASPVTLHPGDSTRGRPGSVVEMPIVVGSGSTTGVQTASLALSFDTTIAEVVGYRRESTTSANAQVSVEARNRGCRVRITDDGGMPEGDTLLVLLMRLYLGDSASTAVTILSDSSALGSRACPDLLPLIVRPGVLAIDSVCGLSYKTMVGGLRTFRIGVLPNPAADQATVAIMAQPGVTMTVDVLDALGRPCMETTSVVCREPLSMMPFNISALPPAAYAVVVRMGDTVQSIPLVVQR